MQARYRRVELAQPEAIAALVAELGAPDILVNNAATRHFGAIEATPPEDWDSDIAVNLSAAFHLTRLSLPGMRARGWGRILNMSSIYGLVGATGRVGYVTTKTALIGLTRATALETAESGITCNALCPGTTLTPNIAGRIGAAMAAAGLDRPRPPRNSSPASSRPADSSRRRRSAPWPPSSAGRPARHHRGGAADGWRLVGDVAPRRRRKPA